MENVNLGFFQNYNIFILAADDNTTSFKNYGITFTGYHIKGLGEYHRARRLILSENFNQNALNESNDLDGFIIGNSDNENQKLFDFYTQSIRDFKLFFDRNKDKIENIKKGINIEKNIQEISKEVDWFNEKNIKEGIIDTEKIETRRTTTKEENLSVEDENYIQRPLTIIDTIAQEMGNNRAIEARIALEKLRQENQNENCAKEGNLINNNSINIEEESNLIPNDIEESLI